MWLKRNQKILGTKPDPVIDLISASKITPQAVFEVGCSNGWRLVKLRNKFGCEVAGLDPSRKAYQYMKKHHRFISPWVGDATNIPYLPNTFDMVIYGFCLYLVDREDLFKAVAEGDRILQDGGYLVVYDFHAAPHSRTYLHKKGIRSFKMDHADLWLAHPAYSVYRREMQGDNEDNMTSVTILKKSMAGAFPLKEGK